MRFELVTTECTNARLNATRAETDDDEADQVQPWVQSSAGAFCGSKCQQDLASGIKQGEDKDCPGKCRLNLFAFPLPKSLEFANVSVGKNGANDWR